MTICSGCRSDDGTIICKRNVIHEAYQVDTLRPVSLFFPLFSLVFLWSGTNFFFIAVDSLLTLIS